VPFLWALWSAKLLYAAVASLCVWEEEPTREPHRSGQPAEVRPDEAPFRHLVLLSHYLEDRCIVERTLRALDAAAARADWPVTIMHAVEERSRMQSEGWEPEGRSWSHVRRYVSAVHKHGLQGERQCLGANLRNAVSYVLDQTDIPIEGTMVTKLGGSALPGPAFFEVLEKDWTAREHAENVAYQPMIHETGHEEWKHIGLLGRLAAYFGSMIHVLPTCLYPGTVLHASFCMPLRMVLDAGSWDPWMLQEDGLMMMRSVLGRGGDVKVRLLRSSVFNAPALGWGDLISQHYRYVAHGWYAVGFSLGNLGLLRGNPLQMLLFAFRVVGGISLTFMLPVVGVLGCAFWPGEWAAYQYVPVYAWFPMQAVMMLAWSRHAYAIGGRYRVAECLVFGPIGGFLFLLLGYGYTLYFFLFTRNAEDKYRATATLSDDLFRIRYGASSPQLATLGASTKVWPWVKHYAVRHAKHAYVILMLYTVVCANIVDRQHHGPSRPKQNPNLEEVCMHRWVQDISCAGAEGAAHGIFALGLSLSVLFLTIAAKAACDALQEHGGLGRATAGATVLCTVLHASSQIWLGLTSITAHADTHSSALFCSMVFAMFPVGVFAAYVGREAQVTAVAMFVCALLYLCAKWSAPNTSSVMEWSFTAMTLCHVLTWPVPSGAASLPSAKDDPALH